MARYIGPKSKIARRFKDPIFGPDKSLGKKAASTGRRRGKTTEYGIQLTEKQKAKYTYGLLERQFRNLFDKAARKQGKTGDNLLKFLEARLDNAVFRLGISPTRAGARQLVLHKHIVVNDKVVNIASFSLRPGDVVGVREKSKSLECIQDSLAARKNAVSWFEWDLDSKSGKFVSYPERGDIPENIRENLIVEFYSKQ
ncbi:MAG: 30S ribosomal protein S4 [Bacteroidetes bacterium]|jgi:small subunit ribosomal protein S4|nr:30S ribosomal protein S4 [Bacteroidota bacterium]MBT5527895.1 30S ribosomal protein S4 [Cytophagia bacterium]MBT3424912.1 30S ribosomal protein S4 [Bacteroidota bacterium]MBT3933950.1 30S ribosomal protein S4 [Bacteroidota bacterium]MBT4338233.1 30S ribosomal protein S4 [Bacteroidota bacterium]